MAVWWILWAALQSGIYIYPHFLSSGAAHPQSQPGDSLIWLAGFGLVAVSSIIRWFVLPRTQNAEAALPLFIVGIAMAESACFLGIFVFPTHQQELIVWSALGIFQFIPYFAGRFYKGVE